jgi:predicted Zn-dependent peptidase
MIRRAIAACVWTALLTGTAAAQAPFPVDVRTVELPNGLELVLAPDPAASAVDVAVWYESGTRHEKAGMTGVAHLFEHLMFRGSAKYGPQQHLRRIAAEGGSVGAFTTADYTCFHQTIPAEALKLVFELEADRMTGLRLTQPVLDAVRAAVRQERARRESAVDRGLQRLYGVAFADHAYRWPVFGSQADLDRLTLAQAREWYAARFGPRDAVVTVTGAFDAAEAEALAKRTFGALPAKKGGAAAATRAGVPKPGRGRETGETRLPLLFEGWRGPGRADADAALFPLIANVLARGPGARLETALVREDQPFLTIEAEMDPRRDGSLLYVVAAVREDADTSRAESDLAAEVERLAAEPLPDAELARAKAQAESGILYTWVTSRGRGQALGASRMIAGDPAAAARQLERIRACTAQDLQRAAAKILKPSNRSVVWVRPSAGTTGAAGGRP